MVDYNDDDELVEKIKHISAKIQIYVAQMGIQARKKVAKDFANQIMIKKLIEVYVSIKK